MDSIRSATALLLAALALPAGAVNHDAAVSPIPVGKFDVACSNIEQDPARIAQLGASASAFWEGHVVDDRPRYITEILAPNSTAIRVNAATPDQRDLYPVHAGEVVEFVAIACHPTSRTNPDAAYTLPDTGKQVPHMQPPGQAPKFVSAFEYAATLGLDTSGQSAAAPAKLPVIVYSHGLGGSPISNGYIDVMVQLAAQGYMVAAVFHGDTRFSRIRLENFSDYWYAVTQFDHIVEMMLMRPVSLKATLDTLLATPGWAAGIDTDRIGAFGASLGGQAVAHLLGARITSTLGLNCRDTVTDSRIRAAVGYVPYAGQTWLPAFCNDQSGADRVTKPYLAIAGSADTTAPQGMAEQAVNRFKGSRYLVSLLGGQHELRPEDVGDLFTWMVTFFNAYMDVRADPTAMARLIKMASVRGGREESLVIDVHVPTSFDTASNEAPVREFYNTQLNHYFLAAWQGEVDIILAGGAGPGWQLTGESFKGYRQLPSDTFTTVAPVCRFYGAAAGGPNSHFFTAQPDACEAVKRMGGWYYEGIGFYVLPLTSNGRCPAGQLEVMRAYNDRFRFNDSNHRYSTSDSTMREMARKGWAVEGTAWCSRP